MKKILQLFFCFICNQAFAKSDLDKNMDDLLKIPLPDVFEIPVTTVSSSTKTALPINQAPSTISAYDYKDIQRLGARKISDLLWLVAGIQVQTRSNGRENIWVRGVQSDYDSKIALYIDNVPIRDIFGGFPVDEAIPVEAIEKIEIIRGPGSALYGANAFSGVINIYRFQAGSKQFDTTKSDRAENTLRGGIGEQNTYAGNFSLQHNLANAVDVMLEGKGLETDGRKPEFDRMGIANSRSNKQDMNYLRLNTSALKGELLFNATYGRFYNVRVDSTAPSNDNQVDKNLRFSLSYKHQILDNLGLEMNTYHTETKRYEHVAEYDINNKLSGNTNFVDDVKLSGIYSALNYRPIKSNQLIAGFEVRRDALIKSNKLNNLTGLWSSYILDSRYQNLVLINAGFFLQDTQNISDKTKFTVGLRYDDLTLFQNQFNYRLGLTHDFNNHIYGKLLYGTAYRTPSFVDFTRSLPGTPLPNVETMKTLEASIGYKDKTRRLSLTGYDNNYQNFLATRNVYNIDKSKLIDQISVNVGQRHIYGVEFESQVFLTQNWNAFLNASWTHASSDNGQQLPLIAGWTTAAGIEWREKFGKNELIFNNQLVNYGNRADWASSIWAPGVLQRFGTRASNLNAGFIVWNTALNYKLPVKGQQTLGLELSVHNLLNNQYYTQALSAPASNQTAFFDNQYQGRQLRFYISYSW